MGNTKSLPEILAEDNLKAFKKLMQFYKEEGALPSQESVVQDVMDYNARKIGRALYTKGGLKHDVKSQLGMWLKGSSATRVKKYMKRRKSKRSPISHFSDDEFSPMPYRPKRKPRRSRK